MLISILNLHKLIVTISAPQNATSNGNEYQIVLDISNPAFDWAISFEFHRYRSLVLIPYWICVLRSDYVTVLTDDIWVGLSRKRDSSEARRVTGPYVWFLAYKPFLVCVFTMWICRGMLVPTMETHEALVAGQKYRELPVVHIRATYQNTLIVATDHTLAKIISSSSGVSEYIYWTLFPVYRSCPTCDPSTNLKWPQH